MKISEHRPLLFGYHEMYNGNIKVTEETCNEPVNHNHGINLRGTEGGIV